MPLELKPDFVSVQTLIPYAMNAKVHSTEQVRQIADLILQFGFTDPIHLDGENVILAGHGRLLAAQLLGMKEVPVVYLTHLSEREKKAYILAHNKVAENATYDYAKLSAELNSLLDSDFDPSITGFNEEELDALLKQNNDLLPALFEDRPLFKKERKKKDQTEVAKKKEPSKIVHTCPHCGEKFSA